MATINAIDARSVHQIQSGQVIVDLCSVVKELVENSLDAKASSVDVRFRNHGLELIEVQDNGEGIRAEDHDSVALKHYTSKLSQFDDLATLGTFGFRGEALSSLSALSSLQITTARAEDGALAKLLVYDHSGKLSEASATAATKGTTVAVADLFCSLPVRKKDLEKNIKREYGRAIGLLYAYACISVGVRFSVSNQMPKGKKTIVFSTKVNATMKDNIMNIFGTKALAALIPLDLEFDLSPYGAGLTNGRPVRSAEDTGNTKVRIRGYISRPSSGDGRHLPDRQMLFVNSRPCILPQVTKIFNEIYKSYNLSQSPCVIANLEMDTTKYDVNVSPDKRTILLHSQSALLEGLKEALTNLFESTDHCMPSTSLQSRLGSSALNFKRATSSAVPGRVHDAQKHPSVKMSEQILDAGNAVANTRMSFQDANPLLDCTPTADHTPTANRNPKQADSARSKRYYTQSSPALSVQSEDSPIGSSLSDASSEHSINLPEATRMASARMMRAGETAHKRDRSDLDVLGRGSTEVKDLPPQNTLSDMRLFRTSQVPIAATEKEDPKIPQQTVPRATLRSHASKSDTSTKVLDPRNFEKGQRLIALPAPPYVQQTTSLVENEILMQSDGDEALRRSDTRTLDQHTSTDPDMYSSSERGDPFPTLKPQEIHHKDECKYALAPPEQRRSSPLCETSVRPDLTATPKDYIYDLGNVHCRDGSMSETGLLEGNDAFIAPSRAQTQPGESGQKGDRMSQGSMTCGLSYEIVMSIGELQPFRLQLRKRIVLCEDDEIKSGIHGSPHAKAEVAAFNENMGASTAEQKLSLVVHKDHFGQMLVVGQFNLGFILAARIEPENENGDELFIIDQHAADEKWNYERLQRGVSLHGQKLVNPKVLELTAVEAEIVTHHDAALRANGFEIEHSIPQEQADEDKSKGSNAQSVFRLLTLPTSGEKVFDLADLEELLHCLSELPTGSTEIPRPKKVQRMLAMRACRSSIMIGKALTLRQMRSVVQHLGEMDKPWNCPHGRPTMRHLASLGSWATWQEAPTDNDRRLWREFGRKRSA